MGYVTKDIAIIEEPRRVSLSALPNFITFKSKPGVKTLLKYSIDVLLNNFNRINPLTVQDLTAMYPDGSIGGHGFLGLTPIIRVYEGQTYTLRNINATITSNIGVFWLDENQNYTGEYLFIDNAATVKLKAKAPYVRFDLPGPSTPGAAGTSYASYGLFAGEMSGYTNYVAGVTEAALKTASQLIIKESDGTAHTFTGTFDASEASGTTFFISGSADETVENLRRALLVDTWVAANFSLRIPFTWELTQIKNGTKIFIESKGAGESFNINITAPNAGASNLYDIDAVTAVSANNDSILDETSAAEIELDIYVNPALFLGQDDRPTSETALGTYEISLQKTYAGAKLWFNLNSLFDNSDSYNAPSGGAGWFDTGTARVYRLVAKRVSNTSLPFYQSSALVVINGYGQLSEVPDLENYIYLNKPITLLTNKPSTIYVRGQREFLNFIAEDPQRGQDNPQNFTLNIGYYAFTEGGVYLGHIYAQEITRANMNIVNTCELDIDAVLTTYPKTGRLKVALVRDAVPVSNYLEYLIRPDYLHALNQVIFLNKLGGWDAFNFDADTRSEIKPDAVTYSKTVTPDYVKSDGIERVYATSLENIFTIEGAPISDEVADWLKELAAARVLLDGAGNYLIKEDFTLVKSTTNKNMHTPILKYRFSETYTNG